MSEQPNCPKCQSEYVYLDGAMHVCPECAFEWAQGEAQSDTQSEASSEARHEDGLVVLDSNGNRLADGDTVTVIKDLKVKGTSKTVKVGTRVKGIRLVEGDHDIDCKIDGIGPMKLKSMFVKKA